MAISSTVMASRLLVRARLRHLQVLVKLGELGSVQRAADAVGLTQPSTSHALAELEKLFDCQLFVRHARGVTPTGMAQAVLPLARRILDTVNDCADVVSALAGQANSVVRVAAISGAVNGILSRVLPDFSDRHPDVLLQVQELDIEHIGSLLASNDVDLVLCRRPTVLPEGWVFETLLDDRFVVVCGPHHPLAKRRKTPLQQLWTETWLLGPLASAPRRAYDELITQAGVSPPLRLISSRSPSILWSMLQKHRLVSLTPYSIARQLLDSGQLASVNVTIPVAIEPIGVMTRKRDTGEGAQGLTAFLMGHRQLLNQ